MFFNARPEYEIERVELGSGHCEVTVKTRLISRMTEREIGAGASITQLHARAGDVGGQPSAEPGG